MAARFFQWLARLSADADPAAEGFQASWPYVVWNIAFPVLFGVAVAMVFDFARKRFSREAGEGPDVAIH